MQLPGRLRATTLTEVLRTLQTAGATGTVELVVEPSRVHRVHAVSGQVVAADVDGATPSLAELLRQSGQATDDVLRRSLLRAMAQGRLHGEVLISDFGVPADLVEGALRRQVLGRLRYLGRLQDAQLHFRVAVRPPRGALARGIGAEELLNSPHAAPSFASERRGPGPGPGASFASERQGAAWARAGTTRPAPRTAPRTPPVEEPRAAARSVAMVVLGLGPEADLAAIKRAYRDLARRLHPDLHPEASEAERRHLALRFAEVTDAYRTLSAAS